MFKKVSVATIAGIAFWMSPLPAEAIAIQSFSRNFEPFLPQTFQPTDSFRLVFSEANAIRPHRLLRIKYIINLFGLPGNPHIFIDIPFFFDFLNADSSSNTTSPTLDSNGAPVLPPDPVNLTLSGASALATTNSFIPFANGIVDSNNFASADLTFDVDTDGLLPGDGFTVSLEQNNTSIGSFDIQPSHVPGPLPLLGLGAFFGYSRKIRKRLNISKSPKLISSIN
ncbi:MAG: hypothetical protein ACK5GV_10590 [Bacteroidota bacterium]